MAVHNLTRTLELVKEEAELKVPVINRKWGYRHWDVTSNITLERDLHTWGVGVTVTKCATTIQIGPFYLGFMR